MNITKYQAIKRLLGAGIKIKDIAEIVGYSVDTIYRVRRTDSLEDYNSMIDKWTKRKAFKTEEPALYKRADILATSGPDNTDALATAINNLNSTLITLMKLLESPTELEREGFVDRLFNRR